MILSRLNRSVVMLLALCGTFFVLSVVLASDRSPSEWLERMTDAVENTSYQGTVIRISEGKAEALKVVHTVSDGVIREKVVAQEGDGLEIIRNGNEVHCILPERKSVLVEAWNDQSTLFSTLPSSDIRFGSEYDVAIVREDRVAGHKTILIAIRPHDEYRFGHRIWLDLGTGFPLQTQLIDAEGSAMEQVKFADITLNKTILASDLAPSYSTDNFKWYDTPVRKVTPVSDSIWTSEDLPAGFRVVSTHEQVLPASGETVTHILFSDGLASVSVFIGAHDGSQFAETSELGASNSFSTTVNSFRITAVGEVPAATVKRIANSTRPQ
jgi:sigma-E factor negative regulatory protein RseB